MDVLHINEGKLKPREKKGIFVGYGDGVKGFRIWSPTERKVILSRDVTFNGISLLHSKTEIEESSKAREVSNRVEFESPTTSNQRDQET